jgi:hypothetical protein
MKTNLNDLPITRSENAEALWEYFEKTGSVQAYLWYSEKVEKTKELVSLDLPS